MTHELSGRVNRHDIVSQAATVHLRAENDLEVRLAVIANGVSRAAILDLVWVSPALIKRALPREARLAQALLRPFAVGDGVDADANVAVAAFHDGEVVSSAVFAGILAVAELDKGLGLPLPSSAPFCVTREADAKILVRSSDGVHLLWGDVDRLRAFEHLEAAGDLVKRELLGERAVVPDVDVERVSGATLDESIGDRGSSGRQGHERSEEQAFSVHNDDAAVMTVVLLWNCVSFGRGPRPCNMLMLNEC